jgi:hypothetical protein
LAPVYLFHVISQLVFRVEDERVAGFLSACEALVNKVVARYCPDWVALRAGPNLEQRSASRAPNQAAIWASEHRDQYAYVIAGD